VRSGLENDFATATPRRMICHLFMIHLWAPSD
jgi:hypothetical protein